MYKTELYLQWQTNSKSYMIYGAISQAHREGGGVAGASAPGPGGPKGARAGPPQKKFKLV